MSDEDTQLPQSESTGDEALIPKATKPRRKRTVKATVQGSAAETLEPPNQLPHYLLPRQDQVASSFPSASYVISRRYAQGIEFADQMGEISGYLATIGLAVFSTIIYALSSVLEFGYEGMETLFQLFALLLLLSLSFYMIRADFIGNRYNPVLVDKGRQQVHIMQYAYLKPKEFFFMPWKWVGPVTITTHDWACARGEVVTMTIVQNAIPRTEHNLVLAFTERPDSNRVVERTGIGTTSAYDGSMGCVNRWEHIRRYMRGEGPSFRVGDVPWTPAAPTFWRGVFFAQPLLGPGSGEYWKTRSVGTYLMGLGMLTIFPLTMYYGLVQWLCYVLKRKPRWPKEIMQGMGDEMDAKDLWRVSKGEMVVE